LKHFINKLKRKIIT